MFEQLTENKGNWLMPVPILREGDIAVNKYISTAKFKCVDCPEYFCKTGSRQTRCNTCRDAFNLLRKEHYRIKAKNGPILPPLNKDGLRDRDIRLLELLALRKSNVSISIELELALSTVVNRNAWLFKRFGVNNRVDLVHKVTKLRIIQPLRFLK